MVQEERRPKQARGFMRHRDQVGHEVPSHDELSKPTDEVDEQPVDASSIVNNLVKFIKSSFESPDIVTIIEQLTQDVPSHLIRKVDVTQFTSGNIPRRGSFDGRGFGRGRGRGRGRYYFRPYRGAGSRGYDSYDAAEQTHFIRGQSRGHRGRVRRNLDTA